ncbi:glycosyltransferase family 2 protein [Micrococcaceae bacterium Sec5.7]
MAIADVTVVIPAYNAAAHIHVAIESAREVGASEVVVVDDGSTDETGRVARELGCRVITQRNGGAALARQAGIVAVATPMVILLDADDEIVPRGVAESFRLADTSTTWALIAGAALSKGTGHSAVVSPWTEGISVDSLLARGHSAGPPGAFLWRTSVLQKALRDDPPALRPRYAEDYELLIRGAMFGIVLCHNEVTCIYASEGGKSALAPLRSNAAAEDIRRFYAKALNLNIRERSDNELQSMAYLRMASACPDRSFTKFAFFLMAAGKSPMFFPALAIRKVRRIIRTSRTS